MSNYIDELAERIGSKCGMSMKDKEERRLLRIYALLCNQMISRSKRVTLEDVHDAWSAWRIETKPDHPSVVPFVDLDKKTQELDRKYKDAIESVGYEKIMHNRDPLL